MSSKILKRIAKLQFMAGQAKPGPALAGLGIDMPKFTREFNEQTRALGNIVVPVILKAYSDRSFEFTLKTSPTSRKILEYAKLEKGSQKGAKEIVGSITKEDVRKIAEYKSPDMNSKNIESNMNSIIGTAKNMGIEIKD